MIEKLSQQVQRIVWSGFSIWLPSATEAEISALPHRLQTAIGEVAFKEMMKPNKKVAVRTAHSASEAPRARKRTASKKRQLTAEQRKAISRRVKKYWAERRKNSKKK